MVNIFFVNGFLEAGKTSFIQDLIDETYFKIKGLTLIVACEEGDEEYDDYLLEKSGCIVRYIEEEEDFLSKIKEYEEDLKPERIIVEFNGMWNRKDLVMPWDPADITEIAIIDARTFELYAANMKSLLSEQVRNAYMAVLKRCDGFEEKLPYFRRNLKAVNTGLNIVFKDNDGEDINIRFEDDLPYDLSADVVDVDHDAFSVFYLDSLENLDRYLGKTIRFTAKVIKPKGKTRESFLAGRYAMTCCENDLSLFGIICDYDDTDNLKADTWVSVTGVVDKEFMDKYNVEFPICKVKELSPAQKPSREIISVM